MMRLGTSWESWFRWHLYLIVVGYSSQVSSLPEIGDTSTSDSRQSMGLFKSFQ